MRRRALVPAVAALLAATLLGGSGAPGSMASAQSTEVIHVGGAPFEANAEAYYAQEEGFFKANGLNVETSVIGNGGALMSALLGGTLQIAGGNPLSVALVRVRGIQVAFVAGGYIYDWANPPGSALVVAANSPVTTAKQLDGKTIGITTNPSIDTIAADTWLEKNGGDPSSIKFIESPPGLMSDAVAGGRFDAAVVGEPALSVGIASGKVRSLARVYDAVGKHVMVTGWVATDDWLAKHPDEARRFQNAINQAAAWAVRNPQLAAQVLQKWLHTTTTTVHEYHARSLDPSLIQPMLDGAARFKLISRPMNASEIIWKG